MNKAIHHEGATVSTSPRGASEIEDECEIDEVSAQDIRWEIAIMGCVITAEECMEEESNSWCVGCMENEEQVWIVVFDCWN